MFDATNMQDAQKFTRSVSAKRWEGSKREAEWSWAGIIDKSIVRPTVMIFSPSSLRGRLPPSSTMMKLSMAVSRACRLGSARLSALSYSTLWGNSVGVGGSKESGLHLEESRTYSLFCLDFTLRQWLRWKTFRRSDSEKRHWLSYLYSVLLQFSFSTLGLRRSAVLVTILVVLYFHLWNHIDLCNVQVNNQWNAMGCLVGSWSCSSSFSSDCCCAHPDSSKCICFNMSPTERFP